MSSTGQVEGSSIARAKSTV